MDRPPAPPASDCGPACARCHAPLVAQDAPLCLECSERIAHALAEAGDLPRIELAHQRLAALLLALVAALALGFALAAIAVAVAAEDPSPVSTAAIAAAGIGASALVSIPFARSMRGLVAPTLEGLAATVGPSLGRRSFLAFAPAVVEAPEDDDAAPPPPTARATTTCLLVVGDAVVGLYRPLSPATRFSELREAESRATVRIDAALGSWVALRGGTEDRPLLLGLDLSPTPGRRVLEALAGALLPEG